ncbi:protein of unknown function [Vibrio xiamenensis]|uniref:YjiS-like domain-containing protein n=1 Tax=Vibrio xiamenensis TaxID=861298 RepID=A0A1G7W1Q8_9VIBR|nr:DUF1127 domain-containing protein [Vibrio xiamenensis]SDG65965.1 protein of unknown function [Vibrio xiamenensis]
MAELVLRQGHQLHNVFNRVIKVSLAKLKQWRQNSRTRHQLSQLSVQQLRDIGIESNIAKQEAKKWFWQ